MKTHILSAEKLLVLALIASLGLDFLQPLIPVPVFALVGVLAAMLLILMYLDSVLSQTEMTHSLAVHYVVFVALISFAVVAFQKNHRELQHSGLLANYIPGLSSLQRSVTNHSTTKTASTNPRSKLTKTIGKSTYRILTAVKDPKYKAGQIKLTPLKPRVLGFKIESLKSIPNTATSVSKSNAASMDKSTKPNTSTKTKSDQQAAHTNTPVNSTAATAPANAKADSATPAPLAKKSSNVDHDVSKLAHSKKLKSEPEIKSDTKTTTPDQTKNNDTQTSVSKPAKRTNPISEQAARAQLAKQGIKFDAATFYKAASNGDLKTLQLFIKAGMGPETQLPYYKQSVIVALVQHNPENTVKTIDFFIKNGFDAEKKLDVFYAAPDKMTQKTSRTLMELAVMNLNIDVAKFLKEKGVRTDNVIRLIAHDLHADKIKAKQDRIQQMYQVLTGKSFVPDSANALNQKLANALKSSNVGLMEFYLLAGAKPDFKTNTEQHAFLLFRAARTAKASAIVKLLLKYGANVNAQSSTGRTALFVHTQMNRYEAVKALLNAKADPNIRANDGSTAAYTAAKENRIAILRLLIKSGAKVDIPLKNGKTPLMVASQNGHQDIVELLLKNGANVKIRDKKGLTPTDYAKVSGHEKIILMLSKKYTDAEPF